MLAAEKSALSRSTVTLHRHQNTLLVKPVTEEVRQALSVTLHKPMQERGRSFRIVTEPALLGKIKPEGLYTRATLEPVVRRVLARNRYHIETIGSSQSVLPQPQDISPQPFSSLDTGLLQTVQEHPWALIRYARGEVDPAWLIAQLALSWPHLRMAVVVRRLEERKQMRHCLGKYGVSASLAGGSTYPDPRSRVTVTTPMGLVDVPGGVEWLDIVIVVNAVEATAKECSQCLSRATRARFYGLLTTDAKFAPLQQGLLHGLFGFEEVLIPRHGCQERQVQVVGLPIAGGMPLACKLSALELKRKGIWHNSVRNRRLSKLALAFSEGDRDRITFLLNEGVPNVPGTAKVAVCVENVEHALVLAKRLRGWPVFTNGNVNTQRLNPGAIHLLNQPHRPFQERSPNAIVTTSALQDLDLDAYNVLIRADGGCGLPPVADKQIIQPATAASHPLLLLDCNDRQHPVLHRQSRWRQHAYQERGWLCPGRDPVKVRVERFLALTKGKLYE